MWGKYSVMWKEQVHGGVLKQRNLVIVADLTHQQSVVAAAAVAKTQLPEAIKVL